MLKQDYFIFVKMDLFMSLFTCMILCSFHLAKILKIFLMSLLSPGMIFELDSGV